MATVEYLLNICDDDGKLTAVLENAQDVTITEEINGERSLEFTLPYNDRKADRLKLDTLVRSYFNNQIYRIKKITASKANPPTVSYYCKHIIYDAKEIFISTFDRYAGAYSNDIFNDIWNGTGYTIMSDAAIDAKKMTVTSTRTDWGKQDKQNPYDLTTGLIENIKQGEFYIDNKMIALVDEIGAEYDVLKLDITKNMDNINIDTDMSSLITRLYPFGDSNLDLSSEGDVYIDSPNVDKYGIKEGYMDFDAADTDTLRVRAQWMFDEQNQNRIDVPAVTISGKFIDLHPIDYRAQRPHLGQRVDVEGYTNKRIIKIVWKPQTPYDTEIKIGQVEKDLFYYFKQFNNTTNEYNSKGKNPATNPQVSETILQITKQEVVAADNIEAASAFIDDLQVERIETNVKDFICKPNLTANGDVVRWTDSPHTYKANAKSNIRGYIKIEGLTQKYIEAHLVVPSDYNNITADELQPLTVNGRQVYFTSVSGVQAFEYLTFTAPTAKYAMTSEQAEMYKVYVRKTESEYIKMQQIFEWSSTDNTYYIKTIYGTGDASGNGKYYFVKDADSGRFVYTRRTDGKELGIAIKDDGTYQLSGELVTKMYPVVVVNDLSEVDSLPDDVMIYLGNANVNYATENYVNSKVEGLADTTYVDNKTNGLASTEYVNAQIGTINTALSNLVTVTEG